MLLPAAADLIHEGIQKSLPDAELEDWWQATAAVDIVPVGKPAPPRDWWSLDGLDVAVLAVVDHRMSGTEAMQRIAQRFTNAPKLTILRALHFCMTADLLRPAFG